jgi:hypothetical protein
MKRLAPLAWLLMPALVLAKDPDVGQSVPDLELASLDGSPVRLADFGGRVVLAKFGATW